MNGSAADQQLLETITASVPTDIAGVVARIHAIDNVLANGDGLKWFNLLYLNVTEKIDTQAPPGGWESPAWLARLDVVFAGLYFTAVRGWLENSANVPSSWKALFEARFRSGVDRIQFALVGMNAHINHDLALALLQTDDELDLVPTKNSPQSDDYEHVNGILEAVLPQALQYLATGILGELAQDTGKIGRLLAIWNVRAARDLAWDCASHLRLLSGTAREVALATQDQLTGVLGRSLLLHV